MKIMNKLIISLCLILCFSRIGAQQELKGQKVQAYFAFEISKPVFCNMNNLLVKNPNQVNVVDSEIMSIVKDYSNNGFFSTTSAELEFVSKFTFYSNGENIFAIRYNEIVDSEIRAKKVHLSHPHLKISEDLATILLLNPNALTKFFSKNSDDSFADIEILKKQFRNFHGEIDVSKLAKCIRSNKSLLKKYN